MQYRYINQIKKEVVDNDLSKSGTNRFISRKILDDLGTNLAEVPYPVRQESFHLEALE